MTGLELVKNEAHDAPYCSVQSGEVSVCKPTPSAERVKWNRPGRCAGKGRATKRSRCFVIRDCGTYLSWTSGGHKHSCRLWDGEGEEKKVCVDHRGAGEADIPTTAFSATPECFDRNTSPLVELQARPSARRSKASSPRVPNVTHQGPKNTHNPVWIKPRRPLASTRAMPGPWLGVIARDTTARGGKARDGKAFHHPSRREYLLPLVLGLTLA